MGRRLLRAAVVALIIAAVTSAVIAVFTIRDYVSQAQRGRPVSWVEAVHRPAIVFTLTAFFVPFIIALTDRFPLARRKGRALAILAAAALLFAAIRSLLGVAVVPWVDGRIPPAVAYLRVLTREIPEHFVVFALITTLIVLLDLYRTFADRERRAVELESRLMRSQLQLLRAQLHPHFLFNTLNAISALVRKDPEKAESMIADLSELLRRALDAAEEQRVTLARELDFVERYLGIQRMRYGEKLRWRIDANPELLRHHVPSMILQPLVENAVIHAAGPRREGGRIEIVVTGGEEALHVRVQDDGPGLVGGPVVEGVGLRNTRARLQQLFGDAWSLALRNIPGGFSVDLTMPPLRSE